MVIACIVCGGVFEVFLITTGLGMLLRWLKKHHNRRKCKCCRSKKDEKASTS